MSKLPLYFFNAEELSQFVAELCLDLEREGFPEPARRLAEVDRTVHTTGSEWLGELQRAAADIRRQYTLPRDLDGKLKRVFLPSYAERVALRQIWQATFYSTIILMFLVSIVALVLLPVEPERQLATWAVGTLVALVALLWLAVRKISVCPGCGLRTQRAQAWCPYCGMHRYSGVPGPQLRPEPGAVAPTTTMCPSCQKPPGGRTRYGRGLPSEGQFCGHCGAHL